jgi:hypothetical protein
MRPRRVDANQPEIVAAFRALGYSVAHTHMVGGGFVDVIVGKGGRSFLIEIKDGSKPPSARKLTKDEAEFHAEWRGGVYVIASTDDVLLFDRQLFSSGRDQQDARVPSKRGAVRGRTRIHH